MCGTYLKLAMLEVKKNPNESTVNLLRRFKNKIRQADIINKAKSKQFKRKNISKALKKKMALKKIERIRQMEHKRRWGIK